MNNLPEVTALAGVEVKQQQSEINEQPIKRSGILTVGYELISVTWQTVRIGESSTRPLLTARPAITFQAVVHHRLLTNTKLYCLMADARA